MPSAPYDTVTTVINAARTRLNDVINTLAPVGGKILDNTQPFSQQVVNDAWRKLQEFLADIGYSGLDQETVLASVPAAATNDPMKLVYLSWSGYFDGNALQVAPVLPQNLIRPEKLWERPSGTTQVMTEMDEVLNGLPMVPKANWNRQWEWRGDALYLPGALTVTDIRIRFAAYLSDFVDNSPALNTAWYAQMVPIMRCLDAFADYMCREISIARGDADGAAAFQTSAEANARLILNRDTSAPKAIYKTSEHGKMRDRYTPQSPSAATEQVKR